MINAEIFKNLGKNRTILYNAEIKQEIWVSFSL
jgi:hypothetical protein